MATIKAGTYRFNDVLSVPSAAISADIKFTVKPHPVEITQEYADAILAEYGVVVATGVYTITYSYDGMSWILPTGGSSFDPFLDYDNQIAKSVPFDANIEAALSGTATEFYDPVRGWTSDLGEDNQTITIPKDTDTSDEFGVWFNANTKLVVASVQYNGSTIANLFGGQTATLKCAGMKMESDVVVEVAEQTESEVIEEYDGTITIV